VENARPAGFHLVAPDKRWHRVFGYLGIDLVSAAFTEEYAWPDDELDESAYEAPVPCSQALSEVICK
jgi:hypothetical protein